VKQRTCSTSGPPIRPTQGDADRGPCFNGMEGQMGRGREVSEGTPRLILHPHHPGTSGAPSPACWLHTVGEAAGGEGKGVWLLGACPRSAVGCVSGAVGCVPTAYAVRIRLQGGCVSVACRLLSKRSDRQRDQSNVLKGSPGRRFWPKAAGGPCSQLPALHHRDAGWWSLMAASLAPQQCSNPVPCPLT
jgi:hypothetical protein